MAFGPNDRKGTGFTNINRVLTANQGNKLGSTVSSGVQNQAANVKTQTQNAQQKFEEEANKNRLDTAEAAEKRSNIIGRFGQSGTTTTTPQTAAVQGTQQVANNVAAANPPQQTLDIQRNAAAPANGKVLTTQQTAAPQSGTPAPETTTTPQDRFAPDMSKFQVSSGLQERYNTQKANFETQMQAQQAEIEKQRASIQARLEADTKELERLKPLRKQYEAISAEIQKKGSFFDPELTAEANRIAQLAGGHDIIKKVQGLGQSVNSLTNLQKTYDGIASARENEYTQYLANLDKEFEDMTNQEREAFSKAERDKLIAANMPTDEEIAAFKKYRAGAYTGPQTLQDYQTLLGNASESEQLGDLTRSTGGQQELLRRFVGGEGYNQGQQRLDTLLLGQSDPKEINQARRSTRGLENLVSGTNEQASNLAKEYTNRAKIFGEETVNQLNQTRDPISQQIDEKLKTLQGEETGRQNFLKALQGTFDGTNESTKGLDRMARLGLGLQSAMDAGYLTQEQADQLLGDGGLIKRAESAGLDTNALIKERMQDIVGQNLNRGGAATKEQESMLTALDKLLGKQGTDIEFGQEGADYEKGKVGFNVDSLKDYITKAEAERAQSDPAFAEQLKLMQPTQLQAAMGGLSEMAGGTLDGLYNMPESVSSVGGLLDSPSNTLQSQGEIGLGAAKASHKTANAVLEGLTKLNIGGKSIANTEAGKQLLKAIEYKSKLEDEALKTSGSMLKESTGGLSDLMKGDVLGAAGGLSGYNSLKDLLTTGDVGKTVGNVSKAVGDAVSKVTSGFGAGETGNWSTEKYNTRDASGKKVKIGSFANKSSGEILNQILSQHQLGMTSHMSKGGAEGAKMMNKLLEYYNAAVKRENAAKKK